MTDFETLYANAYGYAAALLESWLPGEKPYPRLLDVLAQIKAAYEDLRAAHEEELKRHEQRIENDGRVIAAERQRAEKASVEQGIKVLEGYFTKHHVTVKDVITSQWVRGVLSGRQEAINILKSELAKVEMADGNRLGPEDPLGENFG